MLAPINAMPDWEGLLPGMFSDPRFHKSRIHRRRWMAEVNCERAGIVTAWRPADADNHALNREDVQKLLELRQSGAFTAAFIVLASVGGNSNSAYVGHRAALQYYDILKETPFRTGGYGEFWLLRADFSLVDAGPTISEWMV